MKALKIKENIYWVGAVDWVMRDSHGYTTEEGSTYNAYLIIDEKVVLIDTVKEAFKEEMIARISSVIDPKKIDIIISNHGELDHSGALAEVLKYAPNALIYSSFPTGPKVLESLFNEVKLNIKGVRTNDTLNIGKRTLKFVQVPLVHWPDSMVTYSEYDKILFSNDAFGQHFATSKLFDYENNLEVLMHHSKKYYANIVMPYSKQANRAYEAVKDLKMDMIATSHGVIWTKHIPDILNLYKDLTTSKSKKEAVIIYETMYGSTEAIGKAIYEAFVNKGIPVRMYDVNNSDFSLLITYVMEAEYLAIGAPTFNSTILSKMAGFLSYLKGLKPVNKKYIAFGSYGWGGEGVKEIEGILESIGHEKLSSFREFHKPTKARLLEITKEVEELL